MKRFSMDVVLRNDNPRGEEGAERILGCRITASSELEARRAALQRAWDNELLVSRFLLVQEVGR